MPHSLSNSVDRHVTPDPSRRRGGESKILPSPACGGTASNEDGRSFLGEIGVKCAPAHGFHVRIQPSANIGSATVTYRATP